MRVTISGSAPPLALVTRSRVLLVALLVLLALFVLHTSSGYFCDSPTTNISPLPSRANKPAVAKLKGDDETSPSSATTTNTAPPSNTTPRKLYREFNSDGVKWETCAVEDFGDAMLRRWQNAGEIYCDGGTSTLKCYHFFLARHAGPDNFCEANDIGFHNGKLQIHCTNKRGDKFSGDSVRADLIPAQYITWAPLLTYPGSIGADKSSLVPRPDGSPSQADTKTTLFAHRDCAAPYNPFHCFGDIVNAYDTMQMFKLTRENTRIVMLDSHGPTVFHHVWKSLSDEVVFHTDWQKWPPVYMAKSILVPFSGCNFIWKDFWRDTPCPHPTPLYFGFRTQMMKYLVDNNIPDLEKYKLPAGKTWRITILSRERNAERRITNEKELAEQLEAAYGDVTVVRVDMGDLKFEEQVGLMLSTDVLFGMHGGAMQNLVFLKDGGRVVELHPQHTRAWLYGNHALWLDIPYVTHWFQEPPAEKATTPVPLELAKRLIDEVRAKPASALKS